MRRRDEIVVGATIIAAAAVVVAAAFWLSNTRIGVTPQRYSARFQTVGGLGVGDAVVQRGVRVGRVEQIRLDESNWVLAQVQVYEGVVIPERPALLAAARSLFGEWQADIISLDEPPQDPNVRRQLEAAVAEGPTAWPGATLPDVGQLTAQASRIAGDITTISSRIQTVFDSSAVEELQGAIRDFTGIADNINEFTQQQTELIGEVGVNLRQGSDVLADAARRLQASLARVDEATEQGELEVILDNAATASEDVAQALAGLREVIGVARANQASIERLILGADTLMTRLQMGTGTLGLLMADSALYQEATATVVQLRELLADIQANPRKYFKFSVF